MNAVPDPRDMRANRLLQRESIAWDLRQSGKTYREIAQVLAISTSRAQQLVTAKARRDRIQAATTMRETHMPTFIIESRRYPGMRYANSVQEAPDYGTAITQFLAARVPEVVAMRRVYAMPGETIPEDCNLVWRMGEDNDELVAAFTVPGAPLAP